MSDSFRGAVGFPFLRVPRGSHTPPLPTRQVEGVIRVMSNPLSLVWSSRRLFLLRQGVGPGGFRLPLYGGGGVLPVRAAARGLAARVDSLGGGCRYRSLGGGCRLQLEFCIDSFTCRRCRFMRQVGILRRMYVICLSDSSCIVLGCRWTGSILGVLNPLFWGGIQHTCGENAGGLPLGSVLA